MRYALSLSVVAALLSACGGGSSPLAPVPGLVNNDVAPLLKSKTFHFSGHNHQVFVVPKGVTSLTIVARGAEGGGEKGGRGGRVYAIISVSSKEKLYVFVGGQGLHQHGGFNGGGDGGSLQSGGYAFGGGGASDIRIGGSREKNRAIVAAGGGGEGQEADSNSVSRANYFAANGGKGGGFSGGIGESGWTGSGGGGGGDGGDRYHGGGGGLGGRGGLSTGLPGGSGGFGGGGVGGAGCISQRCNKNGEAGGGGGGGYYGGGGGGAGSADSSYSYGGGGGGGGSSYIEPNAKKFQTWRGWKNAIGDGLVVISWK